MMADWRQLEGVGGVLSPDAPHDFTHMDQVIYMLCEACKEGKVDIVSWMCMHNDDIPALVNTRSRCGLLPMDYACMRGHLEVCRVLESHGARVFVPTSEEPQQHGGGGHQNPHNTNALGDTAMHWACLGGYVRVCEWLFNHGGGEEAVNAKNGRGNSPLVMACQSGSVEQCVWLQEHGAVMDPTDSMPMCFAANAQIVEWLCTHGMAPTVTMTDWFGAGSTPMHFACDWLRLDVAEALYNHGAALCVTQPDLAEGSTPLHRACNLPVLHKCCRYQTRFIEWLCTHGAEACVNQEDNKGNTPLALLVTTRDDKKYINLDACEALRRYGAEDTVSETMAWSNLSLDVQLWFVNRYGKHMSDESIAVPFISCAEDSMLRPKCSVDALAMLQGHGARVVVEHVPVDTCETIVAAAVRVGVELRYLEDHPWLGTVLAGMVSERRVFVGVFLFGCRVTSGSSYLWRIGSQHLMAGFRKAVAEYAGVVWRAEEWKRVREMYHAVAAPSSAPTAGGGVGGGGARLGVVSTLGTSSLQSLQGGDGDEGELLEGLASPPFGVVGPGSTMTMAATTTASVPSSSRGAKRMRRWGWR